MKLRRLGWAGIELESGGETLVIDHLIDPGILSHFFGEERDDLIEPADGAASAALVTHLHRDHTDAEAAARATGRGAPLLRPPRANDPDEHDQLTTGESESALTAIGFDQRELLPDDTLAVGPFEITAAFASDGLGSPQVSWIVESDGKRIYHGGDTVWHGAWWRAALRHGPFDAALLPANGAEIAYPHQQPPATTPAVMTPAQAVDAAAALRAKTLIPIHFNRTFEHPDFYRPVPDAAALIAESASERALDVSFPEIGEWIEVGGAG